MEFMLPILFVLAILGGLIAGYAAFYRTIQLNRRLLELENALCRVPERLEPPPIIEPVPVREPVTAAPRAAIPPAPPDRSKVESPKPPSASPEAPPAVNGAEQALGLEMMLGMRGIVWAGVAMLLVGASLFLKLAIDNSWISPSARLLLLAALSLAALVLGQRARRKGFGTLFYSLSGGGLAGLYASVFASVHLYHILGSGSAMPLAVLVTLGAVTLSVLNNSQALALVALLGGYASPVLLSSGENRPHAFFLYLLALTLAAFGSALFRRWRWLNLLCFVCVTGLYQMWHAEYFTAGQRGVAVGYAMLFYGLFLLIPAVHGLLRRQAGRVPEMALVAANAAHGFYAFYITLHELNPSSLKWLLAAQALLAFGFWLAWLVRVPGDKPMAQCLLVVAVLLMISAVPVQMRVYGIPLMWAMQGVALVFISGRFNNYWTLLGGVLALCLSVWGLLFRLPLHEGAFVPVYNTPFASWCAVAAAWGMAALPLRRHCPADVPHPQRDWLAPFSLFAALMLLGTAVSLETAAFWRHNTPVDYAFMAAPRTIQSLMVIWTVLGALVALAADRHFPAFRRVAYAPFLAALLAAVAALAKGNYAAGLGQLFLNGAFLPWVFLAGALLWLSKREEETARAALELLVGVLAALVLVLEPLRWIKTFEYLDNRLGVSLISGAWALEAFALIWLGLRFRRVHLRAGGIALFGLTMAKVILLDTATLLQYQRVLSWLACGALLLVAGWVYHRFSAALSGDR